MKRVLLQSLSWCIVWVSLHAHSPWADTAEQIDSLTMVEEWFAIDEAILNDWLQRGYLGPKAIKLTEEDFKAAADSLRVDPATIHAVVEIEAGPSHNGFWAEEQPVINFSLSLFRRYAKANGTDLEKYTKSYPQVFKAASKAKYGSQMAAVQARLDGAMSIDSVAAIKATYWGMFQIGGFNWKKCGASSPQDFAKRMMRSEHEQMQLFINFLRFTGLDEPLRSHDWARFARGYNGASYARHGYHKRLARAYKKYGG